MPFHCLRSWSMTLDRDPPPPANSRHSSLLTGPLSFSYITLESEKLLPERTLMVIGSNQHLVLPNRQREPAQAL